ncbi:MAG: gamma-glutamylcyclotransferase [Rhodospirillum sp.]|nr:gamma-glutamylcyclotransferase [Rhodospirillum sp.]MCF8489310.1 gamma-glutamylcyclotransferase [Rhodospirillum sp.]MCF8500262.1 gamma-glutamylcyclotransferase [Rhodospirillum sp.]
MTSHITLDRASIAAGALQEIAARMKGLVRPLELEELEASLSTTLAARPPSGPGSGPASHDGDDVWVFAYGSLIWNPAFHFEERRVGMVRGWHRRFCLSTVMGRGTPECPGLVLGLDRGGACRGVAYRVAAAKVREELSVVWRREMVTAAYRPRWGKVDLGHRRVPAILFTINRDDPHYAPGLDERTVAERMATAVGALGPAADYLFKTEEALSREGILDVSLERVAKHARRLGAQKGPPPTK